MKIFSLGVSDSTTSVVVSVSCPKIRGVQSSKVKDWTRLVRKKRDNAWTNKRYRMYQNCKNLLEHAYDCGAKIVSVCNISSRKGNKIQFTFELGTEYVKSVFMDGIHELDCRG